MKRLMVNCIDGTTVNIPADKLTTLLDDANYIVAKRGAEIVGVFDMGAVKTLYLSETGGRNENGG